MPIFKVTAKDRQGRTIVTTTTAQGPDMAAFVLQERGLFVLEVKRAPPTAGLGLGSTVSNAVLPVTSDALALFFRHFAALTKAGYSPAQALTAMTDRLTDRRLARFSTEAATRISQGEPLSASMRPRPILFPPWVAGMVAAAEECGEFDELLPFIQKELSDADKYEQSFRLPLVYLRTTIVLAALVVSLGHLISGGVTAWLLALIKYYFPALILFQCAILALKGIFFLPKTVELRDALLSMVPCISDLRRDRALRRVIRAVQSMYDAHRPLAEAIAHAVPVAGQPGLVKGLQYGAAAVARGERLEQAFAATGLFPRADIEYIGRCEKTGAMDEMMRWLGAEYDRRVEASERTAKYVIWSALILLSVAVIFLGASLGLGAVAKGSIDKSLSIIKEG